MNQDLPVPKVANSYQRSEYGYFLLENNEWFFVPFERYLKEKDLIIILEKLKELKEGSANGRNP